MLTGPINDVMRFTVSAGFSLWVKHLSSLLLLLFLVLVRLLTDTQLMHCVYWPWAWEALKYSMPACHSPGLTGQKVLVTLWRSFSKSLSIRPSESTPSCHFNGNLQKMSNMNCIIPYCKAMTESLSIVPCVFPLSVFSSTMTHWLELAD